MKPSKYEPLIDRIVKIVKEEDASLRSLILEMTARLNQRDIYWLVNSFIDLIEDSEQLKGIRDYAEESRELMEE